MSLIYYYNILYIFPYIFYIISAGFAIITICIYVFMQLSPPILDIIIPLNVSRSRRLYVRFEFFVDEEKYFYVIVFYTVVSLFVASITVISIGTSLLTFGNHSCACYWKSHGKSIKLLENNFKKIWRIRRNIKKFYSYRMEHAMDKYKILHILERNEIQNQMIRAVDIHRKGLELVLAKTTRELLHDI